MRKMKHSLDFYRVQNDLGRKRLDLIDKQLSTATLTRDSKKKLNRDRDAIVKLIEYTDNKLHNTAELSKIFE